MSTHVLTPKLVSGTNIKEKNQWANLVGSSLSLAIYHAARQSKSLTLVITADTPSAIRLEHEIASINEVELALSLFPDWETLPYDNFSPHQDIISQRLATLYRLSRSQQGIVIVPVNTLMHRLAPKQYIEANSLLVRKGDKLDLPQVRRNLEAAGYRAVDQVMEHGEFSARGSILDLFPMGANTPYRLDFFDDEIEEIRLFDPENQRSSDKVDAINLLPAHEFPFDDEAINLFRGQYRDKFGASTSKESIYYEVSKGILPAGIEYYLPLFFANTATLFDYLPNDAHVMLYGDIEKHLAQYWHDIQYRYEDRRYNPMRPLLEPNLLFLQQDELFAKVKQFDRITLSHQAKDVAAGTVNFAVEALPDLAVNHKLKQPFATLESYLQQQAKDKVLFVAETEGRRESLIELLARDNIQPKVFKNISAFLAANDSQGIVVNLLGKGFAAQTENGTLSVITESELLGDHVRQTRRRRKGTETNTDAIIKNLAELVPNQPVVHIEHGIGRYLGLQTLETSGISTEFLVLAYANEAKLYVPVASLHLISRYSGGDSDHAPLHRLGNETWSKAKQKAAEKVRDVAAELLDIYAKRENSHGYAYKLNKNDYGQFADGFGFEETIDQENAINAVKLDMCSDKTMDRLVCGDVGFGKTEVAMRAAFIAVNDGKQVAILVPTTLLAQQHYENFKDRFANWPVNIEVLSRFKSTKEQNEVIRQVEAGKVDILIGTHKLLQNSIKYKDLGLLIVDEEHRFGVKQKEKIKQLRSNVDILTLTATPIPRTLNMAMGGMRDLSIIATPPARRLAVKTFVRQRDNALIREAMLREILRGGQVYFLHNNVETIEKTAHDIRELVPEANVIVAHGQMPERSLEKIMSDFYHQRYNVLVCTTIVETGIDIPSANTIIMDRADNLGLAQLHQLRGRVGRSHHQAYAYLLTPHEKRMTKDAKKRLDAIANLEDLGAGFALATHDLEIRGAGELLGEEQSGQMTAVGFSLYMEMLDDAVKALKEGKQPSLDSLMSKQTDIDLRVPALLPEDYIFDVSLRLSFYKRLASCKTADDVDEIQVELIDRFGLLPDATKNLATITKLRLKAQALGISRIDAGNSGGSLEFNSDTRIDPMFVIGLVQTQPQVYKMEGANKLSFKLKSDDSKSRLQLISSMLAEFSQRQTALH